MTLKKSAAGIAAAVAVTAASAAMAAGTALAAEDYTPTTLGNSAYTNHVDVRNDIYVDGMNYLGPIAAQNADTVAAARACSITVGTESDATTPILLENGLGADVTALALTTKPDGTGFGSNLLSATLPANDAACWNFVYAYELDTYTNHDGHTYQSPVTYTLQATLADGTKAEFHNLNMNGVRSVKLKYSPDYDVYYVERTTITNHTPDPNLYYEVNRTEYEGGDEEFDFHVNSAVALDRRQINTERGEGAWMLEKNYTYTDIPIYAANILLYGTSEGDYTAGLYDELHWNSDSLPWRANDYDVRSTLSE